MTFGFGREDWVLAEASANMGEVAERSIGDRHLWSI